MYLGRALKGIILAAGKGTRLYPVTHHIPKPLLPLANHLTIEYAFDQLRNIGVFEVGIVINESQACIKEALGDGSAFGLDFSYIVQFEQKGIAHALGHAKDFLGLDDFVLYLGDTIYEGDFITHANLFRELRCANLSLLKVVEDPRRFGVATLEGERIVKLVEKPAEPESHFAMAGVYFFRNAIWNVLPELKPSGRDEYEITDAIQMLIERGECVIGSVYEGEWFDTGTLDSFLEASRFLVQGKSLVDASAEIIGKIGPNVVVGKNAKVFCEVLEDCVILPNACVHVDGRVSHCILGGHLEAQGNICNSIIYN